MQTPRWMTPIVVLALLATACGARLTDDQRDFVIAGGPPGAAADAGEDGGPIGPTAAPRVGPTSGGTVAPTADSTAGPGGSTDGGDDGQSSTPGADPGSASTDTRAAPRGGNGGATDTGVTESEIVVVNAVDRSGAVPGLFQDAQEAVAAYFAYFAATEGTVYGRSIRLVQRDTKLSTQENRSVYLDACNQAFAAVGSMSAFEHGAADPIEQCGIPDLRTAAVNEAIQVLPSVYSALPQRPGVISLSEWAYYESIAPEAVAKAGFVYIDNDTTRYQTRQYIRITEQRLGYDWIYDKAVGLSEVNYASYVSEMKSAGVELVAFQGAYQQAVRLARAMAQQGMRPTVYALQANTYTPDMLAEGADVLAGYTFVAQTGSLLEEIDRNPELQLYDQWLRRLFPDRRPTGLGMYGWSAAKLFIEGMKEIGPEVTRERFLDFLSGTDGWTANDMLPEQPIGSKGVAGCNVMLGIEGGRFVRVHPSQPGTYQCRAGG